MDNLNSKKCAHRACTCPAASDSKYCSPACESGKGSENTCGCEHADCAGARAVA